MATPIAYGAVTVCIIWLSGLTISGETNWPRYREAEISGITVVAASLPPFMDAIVFRYGTPTPLAIPIKAEPTSSRGREVPKANRAYPARNPAGGTYLICRRIVFINLPNMSPMQKATMSNPTMISVMVVLPMLLLVEDVSAKFVG